MPRALELLCFLVPHEEESLAFLVWCDWSVASHVVWVGEGGLFMFRRGAGGP